jgi:glutaredoxin
MNLPAFTLYGLLGCPHCADSEAFLRTRNLSTTLIIANGDPIISEGIKKVTDQDQYPVLFCRLNNEIVRGFNQEAYERLANLYYSLSRPSIPSVFGNEQQFIPQNTEQNQTSQTA